MHASFHKGPSSRKAYYLKFHIFGPPYLRATVHSQGRANFDSDNHILKSTRLFFEETWLMAAGMLFCYVTDVPAVSPTSQ